MVKAVPFDVDGTLVDSNDAHADAWVRAFADHGVTVDRDHVRRCIGMGGDKLMPEVSGIREASPEGTAIADRRGAIVRTEFLPTLQPFRDAGRLRRSRPARWPGDCRLPLRRVDRLRSRWRDRDLRRALGSAGAPRGVGPWHADRRFRATVASVTLPRAPPSAMC
ncbi:MAG: HAD hydrolase-like protein [Vicinamibacteraceae bacterium]